QQHHTGAEPDAGSERRTGDGRQGSVWNAVAYEFLRRTKQTKPALSPLCLILRQRGLRGGLESRGDYLGAGSRGDDHGSCGVVFCLCFLPFLVVDSNLRAQQSAGEEERYERLVRRGKEAEATRDWNQAVGSFEEALRLRPKSISLQTKVAALYFDRKNYEKTL